MALTTSKHAGIFSNLAGKLRGVARGAAPALAQEARGAAAAAPAMQTARTMRAIPGPRASGAVDAFAPTVARPSHVAPAPAPMGGGWGPPPNVGGELATRAGRPSGVNAPPRAPTARPDPSQSGSPVDSYLPGFLAHDRRLRGVQGKLQARAAAGTITPARERMLDRVDATRKDLHRQLVARSGSEFETHVEPHLRAGREVALRPGGMTSQDEQELVSRTLAPRRGSPEARGQRMMPALSQAAYDRQAATRGAHDPAMRSIAGMLQGQRDRAAMTPRAIQPKLGGLRKAAFLGGALKRFGDLAHADPVKALTRAHAADQGVRGALYGGLIGGAGGALLARPGDEEGMGLRGALAGALGGGGYGALAGHRDARNFLATPEGVKALAGRLAALRGAGGPLAPAFTA